MGAKNDRGAASEVKVRDPSAGEHSVLKNPNATAACGCGTSFSI